MKHNDASKLEKLEYQIDTIDKSIKAIDTNIERDRRAENVLQNGQKRFSVLIFLFIFIMNIAINYTATHSIDIMVNYSNLFKFNIIGGFLFLGTVAITILDKISYNNKKIDKEIEKAHLLNLRYDLVEEVKSLQLNKTNTNIQNKEKKNNKELLNEIKNELEFLNDNREEKNKEKEIGTK